MDRGDATRVSRTAIALTIAGSDSGGGAGVQADLKTFAALGVYGASVITALTAQNTLSVRAIHAAPPDSVAAQIEAVLEDFHVAAIKIGMLANVEILETVAARLPSPVCGRGVGVEGTGAIPSSGASRHLLPDAGEGTRPLLVYDPVLAASSGVALASDGFVEAIRARLLPLIDCLTPNLSEAARLLDEDVARSESEMARQGDALLRLGPRAILMKGGHLEGDAIDLLVTPGGIGRYSAPRIASRNLHGTGCTLSSAIAAFFVLGLPLPEAVASAKAFVRQAIELGRGVTLGAGPGPLIRSPLRTPRQG